MNIAGKFLDLTQGVAEAAFLSRLRSKYKMNFNLEQLAAQAKQELQENNIPITPTSLLATADQLASFHETAVLDLVGTENERWNSSKKEYETYIIPDPRIGFIR